MLNYEMRRRFIIIMFLLHKKRGRSPCPTTAEAGYSAARMYFSALIDTMTTRTAVPTTPAAVPASGRNSESWVRTGRVVELHIHVRLVAGGAADHDTYCISCQPIQQAGGQYGDGLFTWATW